MQQSDPTPSQQDLEQLQRHLDAHPHSPLVFTLADLYARDSMPATALRSAEAGLTVYPEHAGGLLIAAKASILLRRYNDARQFLERLLEAAPGSSVAASLMGELSALELRFPPSHAATAPTTDDPQTPRSPRTGRQKKRWSWEDHIIGGATVLATEETVHQTAEAPESEPSPDETHDDHDLELLAQRLEGARILPVQNDASPEEFSEQRLEIPSADLSSRPVTETLAQIYAGQSRYREALEAYRELRERHPERTYEFTLRIIEIERLAAENDSPTTM